MDKRDELAKKCLLIKSVPKETDEETITRSIERLTKVERVCCYREPADESTRFIVQLQSREDACRLIQDNDLSLITEAGQVKVTVGFCPECILPNEWLGNWPCDTCDDGNHLTGNRKDISRNFTQETLDQSSDESSEEDPDQFVNNLSKEKSYSSSRQHRSAETRPQDYRTTEVQEEHRPSLGSGDENLHFQTKTPIEDLIQDDIDDYGKSENPNSFLRSESLYESGNCEQDVYVPSFTIPAKPVKQTKSQGVGKVESKEAEITSQYSNREEQEIEHFSEHKVTPTENVKKVMDGDIYKVSQGIVGLDLGQSNDNQSVRNDFETSPSAFPREGVNPRMKAEGYALNTENEISTIGVTMPKSVTSGQNNPGVYVTDHQNSRQFNLQEQNLKIDMQSSAVGKDTRTASTNPTVSSEEQTKQELYPKVPSSFEQSNAITQIHSSGNTGNVGHVHTDQQRFLMHQQVTGQNAPSHYNPYNMQFANIQQRQGYYQANQQMPMGGDLYRHPQPFFAQYPSPGMIHQPLQPGFSPVMQQQNQVTNLYGDPRPVQPFYGHSNAGHQAVGPSAPPPTYSMVQRGEVPLINPSQQQPIVPSAPTATNSMLAAGAPSGSQTSHRMLKSKDGTKETEKHNLSKSQIEEEEELKKLSEWSQSGGTKRSTIKGENSSNQTEIGKNIKDQAEYHNFEAIQHHFKRKTGSADRQKSPEPMEWEHSSSAGTRQKRLSTKDSKSYSYKQEKEEYDTDSDGYESIAEYTRDWAQDENQTELNFGFLKIIKGELSTMKTDVIVNPTNIDLDLKVGKVSRSLMKAGGEKIQQECKKKYKNGIKKGEIACTKAGNLKCRRLFHCIAPQWDGGSGTALKDLEELIGQCLQKAERKSLKSIAFPALGSGQLGFPVDTVAHTLINTVIQHQKVANSVKAVVVVLHPSNRKALKAFDRTSKNVLGPPFTKSLSDEDSSNYAKLEEFDNTEHVYVKFKTGEQGKEKSYRKHSQEEEHLYESIYPVRKEESPYMSMRGQPYMSMKPRSRTPSARLRITWTSDLTLDDLTFYFENEKRSGGGDIKSSDICLEMKEGVIEFEKPETVDHILKKGTEHTVNKSVVKVQKITGTESTGLEEKKVLVDGLNPKTTEDCLINFLEVKTEIEVDTMMYSDTKERAVVSFTQEPDISKLKSTCEKKKLEGHTLRISKVLICRSVFVTGLQGNVTEDTVWLFFESSNRCDGGDVEKVELNVEDNTAVVFFVDPKVARQVVETKKKLQLGGSSIRVSLFYPFLRPEKPKVKLPDPISLSDIDPNIIKFILNSKVNRDALLSALGKENAAVEIIQEKELKISCNLDLDSKNIATVVKLWKNQVQKVVKQFFDVLVTEEVPVTDKAWNGVLEQLKDLVISHPDGVAVVLNSKDYNVIVVGHRNFVLDLKQTIEGLVMKTEHELKQQSELMTKKEHLKMYQIQLLWRSKFQIEVIKAVPKLAVEIDVDNKQITFTGNLRDVEEGRIKMHEKLESFVSDELEISAGQKDLFFRGRGREVVVDELKKKSIWVVWDIAPSSLIMHVYSSKKKDLKQGIEIIQLCLQEKKIVIKDHFEKFMTSKCWQKTLMDLKEKYANQLSINSENSEICVTAIYDVFKEVFLLVEKEVKDFVSLHKVSTKFVHVDDGVMQFMKEHEKSGISGINTSLHHLHLKLKECTSRGDSGYEITGTKDGIKLAEMKLQKLIDAIMKDTHSIVSFGALDFFTSRDGSERIKVIETVNKCVIHRKTDVVQYRSRSKVLSAPPVIRAKCKVGDQKLISVAMGDMTQLSVDVIVNAANEDLHHGAGLAGAIVEAGGREIQLECNSYIKKYGTQRAGRAVIGAPGRLPCEKIVHAVGPTWKGGKSGEEVELRSAVKESLKLAKQHKSIAFPALSTGKFSYPLDLAVETIVDEVKKFLKQDTGMIDHVYFCDVSNATVSAFIEELKSAFGQSKVKLHQDMDEEEEDDEGSDASSSSLETTEREDKSSIKINLIKGEIARTQADVIVNSTQRDLNLDSGAISKAILQHGGQTLQTECNINYPNGVKPGEIAVTSGGTLNCSEVYHGAFPQWDGGKGVCDQILKEFVTKCLTTADQNGLTSVAFPAIGTGQLKWPADNVANIMYRSVMDFSRKNPQSFVSRVDFVVFPRDVNTVQDFEDEEQRINTGAAQYRRRYASSPRIQARPSAKPDKLGCLKVSVKKGDITVENAHAIVNSTDSHMDLTRGAISKAILAVGGSKIQKECNQQKQNMQTYGLAVTSGGALPCHKIIHMKSQSGPDAWEKAISNCLQFAEKLKCDSLAMPALGTGIANCDPQQMARSIFRAIRQFKGPTKYLKEVKIVIFQSDMADIFRLMLIQQLKGGDKENGGKHQRSGSHHPTNQKGKEESTDTVHFLIWSKSERQLKKAKFELDDALDKEIKKEIIPQSFSDVIKALTDYQMNQLHSIAADFKTKMDLSQNRGNMKVIGRSSNVSKSVLKIIDQLREYEKHKEKLQQAKTITNYVQWYYEHSGKMKKYNAELNNEIESAYKAKQTTVKIRDGQGGSHIIDFSTMESKHRQTKVKVERKEVNSVPGGIALPKEWSAMSKGESVKCVTLATNDPDYIKVSSLFASGTGIPNSTQAGLSSFPNMGGLHYGRQLQQGIIKIERIQNKYLFQQYAAKKSELQIRNKKDPEKLLWHGTSADTVQNIIDNGFNRSYCGKNGTAYGNGVYFAVNASLSLGYCKGSSPRHMFLVQVLTGETCQGSGGLRVLPFRAGHGSLTYDSACDHPNGPSMYVIFHDSQAYPKYHITFN